MKIKVFLVTLTTLFALSAYTVALPNDKAFKPGAQQTFQILLQFLDAHADTKFTDYGLKTQKQYEGDIQTYLRYSQDYKDKFSAIYPKLDTYTEQDLIRLLGEISLEFRVVESVLAEFKRARERKPNLIMNQVLVDFIQMFVLVVKTVEGSIVRDDLLGPLRDRVQKVEKEVEELTGKSF
jgi:hypothetical protein